MNVVEAQVCTDTASASASSSDKASKSFSLGKKETEAEKEGDNGSWGKDGRRRGGKKVGRGIHHVATMEQGSAVTLRSGCTGKVGESHTTSATITRARRVLLCIPPSKFEACPSPSPSPSSPISPPFWGPPPLLSQPKSTLNCQCPSAHMTGGRKLRGGKSSPPFPKFCGEGLEVDPIPRGRLLLILFFSKGIGLHFRLASSAGK